ncbi:rhomboid family intramembrane serine protease [Methanonatronarchaeum sp. AMET-Sl]|uniref:rhomboid family intramembrane serine protease n=1 Tax=Methanonatronarchaeum sp. AMET-Sl TaxID=3037654 RepID=UPI00244E227B|nr:rhomboid family intramembrane serine protease [Methanonatronarchaeum sp. AMET-Sl]WGI17814.1 rhomboid family intramembrane serine protease [Methanonatronarchaeum sp. AMET-Sl]
MSSWSHMSLNHLFSNMLATLVFAPLVEIIFNTGARETRFFSKGRLGSFLSWPFFRAVILFPITWFVVGVALSMGTPPGIGFSAIVFALIGFCAVLAPVLVIVLLLVNIILNNLISVLLVPVEVTRVTTVIAEPSWAGVGIWAHLLGFLFGILIAVAYYFYRGGFKKPEPLHAFFAVFIIGLMMGLDLPFSYVENGEYILFSAAGFILVLVLATLVYLYWRYVDVEKTKPQPLNSLGGRKKSYRDLISRQKVWKISIFLILFLTLVISFTFVGAKITMDSPTVPDQAYTVEGYDFWFKDGDGVLVYNEDREIYTMVASPQELVSERSTYLYVGGALSYERVDIHYSEISPVDGNSVGSIWIDSKEGLENLYTGPNEYTGLEVGDVKLYVGFDIENKSYLIEGRGETDFNISLSEREEHIVEEKGFTFELIENEIWLTSDEFTGVIAEVTSSYP